MSRSQRIRHEHRNRQWAHAAGHWGQCSGDFGHSRVNVADEQRAVLAERRHARVLFRIPLRHDRRIGERVRSYVNNRRARPDELFRDEPGTSNGGYNDVRFPADGRKVGRLGVANGHCRVALEEQERHRLADDLASAKDTRPPPCDPDPFASEQFDDAERGTWNKKRAPLHESADAAGSHPVDVFSRGNRVEHPRHGALADGFRERRLNKDPIVRPTLIQSLDQPENVCKRRGLW
jgi:hypothetical protein